VSEASGSLPPQGAPTGLGAAVPDELTPAVPAFVRRHRRAGPALLIAWAAVLVAGFAVVFTLGSPLPSSDELRADAYAPLSLPLSEAAVRSAAERIVQLDYGTYADATPAVRQGSSQGVEIWTVTYAHVDPPAGVRITISGDTGAITVAVFP
jgi:hypothetical protein